MPADDTPPGEREEREALATVLVQRRVGYLWRSASGVVWGAALDDADAILAAGFRRAAAPEWIDVREKMPETHTDVLVVMHMNDGGAPIVQQAFWNGEHWREPFSTKFDREEADITDVYAWRPLPAPPTSAEAARGKP